MAAELADDIAAAARRHGLSEAGGHVLFEALVRGGGSLAQFSHPDLGGMGQWSGGMTQIGDMFNDALKARVNGFCTAMSVAARDASRMEADSGVATTPTGRPASPWAVPQRGWWPSALGVPASSGSQNDMSYACFPDARRLAIKRSGIVTLYDTGEHRITGFSQQQSTTGHLTFSGPGGSIALDSLRIAESVG